MSSVTSVRRFDRAISMSIKLLVAAPEGDTIEVIRYCVTSDLLSLLRWLSGFPAVEGSVRDCNPTWSGLISSSSPPPVFGAGSWRGRLPAEAW